MLFSCSVMSDSLTPWTTPCKASLSFTVSWNLLKLMSIDLVMPSSYLKLCLPFLLLPSIFPSITFLLSWLFSSSGESIRRFSFSISPSDEYSGLISFRIDWLISLLSKGSQESFSSPHFRSINSSVLSL